MIFYFRLARELGMTVGRLLKEASSREIGAWMAYLSLENDFEDERKKQEEIKKDRQGVEALKAHLTMKGERAAVRHGKGKI